MNNIVFEEFVRTIRIESNAIADLENNIDVDTLAKVVSAIEKCSGKIVLSACGTSAMAAKNSPLFVLY